jgi:imidazolonepropionase-like amidohydrolase
MSTKDFLEKDYYKTLGVAKTAKPAEIKTAYRMMLLTHMSRWYSNAETLRMATAGNAELLALSGPRNPYPGKLGVIEDGAYADLLVVAGDPLQDLNLLAEPDKNLVVIMKDGKIHKDARAGAAPTMGSVIE